MKELLWISLRAPYDKVPHAGGKNHNYYIKQFQADRRFNIRLLSFCYPDERMKIDLDDYAIAHEIFVLDNGFISLFLKKLLGIIGAPISLFQYTEVRKCVKKSVRKYSLESKYNPDVIILHWTEIVMMFPYVKKVFPNSKIICIEEDVTFLKLERKYKKASGMKALFLWIQYKVLKKLEMRGIRGSELVLLLNRKDQLLLIDNGIKEEKTIVSVPYFENMKNAIYEPKGNDILFYGAMNRPENEEAAIWLIENVLPYLEEKISDVRLIILGSKPSKRIRALESERIIVTGFVDNVVPYFERSLCLASPLQMGAGIKIKILEGLSAGIPVLTNYIGIEGIPAVDKQDYLLCETPKEYILNILELSKNLNYAMQLSCNAKKFIADNYNITIATKRFIDIVDEL